MAVKFVAQKRAMSRFLVAKWEKMEILELLELIVRSLKLI
jgi:hypothetical protein